ncbi:MAG: tripartite tricarboxylate transporter TctB family protein [Betaproteobacteria bacterium]|nr:tripartite tricarboxylate transporter TctB family protein [Betaproteobacteria bacterium]
MLEKVLASVLAGVGAIWFAASWNLASGAAGYGGAFPLGLSALLVALSLLLLVTSRGVRGTPAVSPPPGTGTAGNAKDWNGTVAAAWLVALLGGYAIFFDLLGFVLVTLLFGAVYLRLLHRASWKASLVTSVLLTLGGYLVFRVLLGVPLPTGLLVGEIFG